MTDAPPALRLPFGSDRYDAEPLRTERTLLRPIRESDAADIWEYQRLEEVLRYIPWPTRTRVEGYEHTAKRAGLRTLAADEDAIMFACLLEGEPAVTGHGDRVIGDVMLRLSDAASAGVEIGWSFHPDFHGRGLATEAARAVLGVAFDDFGAHRVHANLDARNTASAALCSRLGMRHEATFLADDWFKGEWTDTEVYGILRTEWSTAAS